MDVIAVELLLTAINKYIQKSGPHYRMWENPAPPKAWLFKEISFMGWSLS